MPGSTPTVFLADDEANIVMLLEMELEAEGFTVVTAADGITAIKALREAPPDLALLDWNMPGMTGLDICRRLRETGVFLPVIMITARDEMDDRVAALDAGADDFISKPFNIREVLARVKALLRRSGAPENNLLEACGITLNLDSHRITIQGNDVHTGPTEFRLLELLMRNPDRAFDRNQLLDRVWGRSVYVEERTVDVHILRLRKLLKPYGLDRTVQTVRSVGYRFSPN